MTIIIAVAMVATWVVGIATGWALHGIHVEREEDA